MRVDLKYAGVPYLGMIAVHYWFVTNDLYRRERWEVWQNPNAGGRSNGHLHRNLMHPDSNVGGSRTQLEYCWEGEPAQRIADALRRSWSAYPHRMRYRAVPGPNSNTFAAWILRDAGIRHTLSWRGIGRNFLTSA